MLNKEEVKEIIEEFQVNKRTNKREIAYMKFYMCHYIRKNAIVFSLQNVADLVGYKKHYNVLYALGQYDTLKNDKFFKKVTEELATAIRFKEQGVDRVELTLEQKVLKCENFWEMRQLQEQLKLKG